jgi:hypothetical protein
VDGLLAVDAHGNARGTLKIALSPVDLSEVAHEADVCERNALGLISAGFWSVQSGAG